MKTNYLSAAIFLIFTITAHAQYIVYDPTSLSETLARWKVQYEQMQSQIDSMKTQYEAITGKRNLGNIFNNPTYRDYLSADWQEAYDSIRDSGYTGLTNNAKSIFDANKIYDSCAYIKASDERKVCEAKAVKSAQDKDFSLEAYNNAKNRINQIDQLMSKINDTSDPKAIQELQARIAIEQANIQNEQIKLQMYSMVATTEDRLQEQRQSEIQARTWAKDKLIHVNPVKFNPK